MAGREVPREGNAEDVIRVVRPIVVDVRTVGIAVAKVNEVAVGGKLPFSV